MGETQKNSMKTIFFIKENLTKRDIKYELI